MRRGWVNLIRLLPDRETALRIGYEATDWNEKPSYERYVDALAAWTVRLMDRGGEPIGAVYTHGQEFHVSVLPAWRGRWATRGVLKQIIAEPVSMTRVSPGFAHVGPMLGRIGFEDRGSGVFVREV